MLKTRKRKRILVGVAALVVLCLVVWQLLVAVMPITVAYEMNTEQIYPPGTNALNVTCSNSGSRSARFNIVLTLENAFVSSQTMQPYIQVNARTVKLPFTLHGAESAVKPVFFLIDNNAASFSFHIRFETAESNLYGSNVCYLKGYEWNATSETYRHTQLGLSVP